MNEIIGSIIGAIGAVIAAFIGIRKSTLKKRNYQELKIKVHSQLPYEELGSYISKSKKLFKIYNNANMRRNFK